MFNRASPSLLMRRRRFGGWGAGGGGGVARKLLWDDVVLLVPLAGAEGVTVCVLVILGKYFVSVKYVFVCIKLMCAYVKLLKI
jgi:hypothetical protein